MSGRSRGTTSDTIRILMSRTPHLSLLSAIIININIMLGSGIFLNTALLASKTEGLGSLAYGLVGILFLPLILVFSQLLSDFPGGSFYEFGAAIHPFIGFLNSWIYFVGKLATPAVGIHIFITVAQTIMPALAGYNPLMLDAFIITFFVGLNLINLRTGKSINYLFITLKLIPILFVLFAALFLFDTNNFNLHDFHKTNLIAVIPLVIFAFTGFEASCSLSKQIIHPEKNGPRAILFSFSIVLMMLMLYQACFFGSLGTLLSSLTDWKAAFPILIQRFLPNHESIHWFLKAITLSGIAASSLGASYGVIYSNFWNLHILAQHGHVFGANWLIKKNRYGTPFLCVLIAGLIIFCYQWCTKGNQISLQQISAAGNLMAYSISVSCFLILSLRNGRHRLLAIMSVISTLLLATSFKSNIAAYGANSLGAFMVIILAGTGMYLFTSRHQA